MCTFACLQTELGELVDHLRAPSDGGQTKVSGRERFQEAVKAAAEQQNESSVVGSLSPEVGALHAPSFLQQNELHIAALRGSDDYLPHLVLPDIAFSDGDGNSSHSHACSLEQLSEMLGEADSFGYTPVQRAYDTVALLSRHSEARTRCRRLMHWMLTAQLLLAAKNHTPLHTSLKSWSTSIRLTHGLSAQSMDDVDAASSSSIDARVAATDPLRAEIGPEYWAQFVERPVSLRRILQEESSRALAAEQISKPSRDPASGA